MAVASYSQYVQNPCFLENNNTSNHQDFASGTLSRYQVLNMISGGSYGVVFKAWDKMTGEIVAVKRENKGLSKATQREIGILKSLVRHPSIVELKQVVVEGWGAVFVVMEYLEYDLKRLMDATRNLRPFSMNQVKGVMKQLLEGVKFLHDNKVMHRDLKPSNLLMNKRGLLKICDFGLSRRDDELENNNNNKVYSPHVVTLWYRAPELLLGAKNYTFAIDMWSVGCIMAELMMKEALFKGCSEIQQLYEIYSILGMPNDVVWPGFSSLPGSRLAYSFKQPYSLLRNKLMATAAFTGGPVLSDLGFDLLDKLLAYDPEKRITAEAALSHGWFTEN